MVITFLVGNGFDIAAGIDTSYKSFYKWYFNQPSNSDSIDEFKRKIEEDIANDGETWADFEIGLGQYTTHISPDSIGEFFECYEDAHDKIVEYIKYEKSHFNFSSFESEIKQFRDGLLNFYQELPPKERKIIHSLLSKDKSNDTRLQFVSFNYTDVLDQCVQASAKEALHKWTANQVIHYFKLDSSVVHTHGTLDEYPVLGVDNVSQIANPLLLPTRRFLEIMIKSESVDSIGQLWHEEASARIAGSDIICIYGMSLGDSDTSWWKKLMSWLTDDPSRHLIVYWYADSIPNSISIWKRNNEIDNVKQRLLKFFTPITDIPNPGELIQDRIHVILNTEKVLKVSLAKSAFVDPVEKELAKI